MGRADEDARHAAVWEGARSRQRTADHWAGHGWEPGERRLTWFCVLDDPALQRAVTRLQQALDLPFLDPLAPDELHLTVQGVAPLARVPARAAYALAVEAAARLADLAPFAIDLRGLNSFDEGVFAQVHGWNPLVGLRRTLRAAIAKSVDRGLPEDPEDGFFPHLSVAYANAPADAAPLAAALAPLRDASIGTWAVGHVELVELRRDGRHYRWDRLHRLPLGG